MSVIPGWRDFLSRQLFFYGSTRMLNTPKALRLHIALFGLRNVGKSSLLNALSGQQVAIVSDVPGTTTDPVEKTLELAPLGPVVLWDTAGLDDTGELGHQRVRRSLEIMPRLDMALLVTDNHWGPTETLIAAQLRQKNIPFAVVWNKADTGSPKSVRPENLSEDVPCLCASARTGKGLNDIRAALEKLAPQNEHRPLVSDLLPDQGLLILVVPLDSGAPKGRLIMPQVQTIRDSLDGRKVCMVCTDHDLPTALNHLQHAPDLVVCDSQVVHTVDKKVPQHIAMTTFSVLMARFKGDLSFFASGAAALTRLNPGDKVLIQEACSHHPQQDDIGRVKIPRLLQKLAGGQIECHVSAGKDFAKYEPDLTAAIHCGGCTITRGHMLTRQRAAAAAGCPMTNYGLAISLAQGVLSRVLSPFPDALRAFEKAVKIQ